MSKQLLKAAFTLFMTLIAGTAIGQNAEADARLSAKFNEQEISSMTDDDLAFWNAVVTSGYRIEVNTKVGSDMKEIDMSNWESDELNILEYGLEPMETHVQTYAIKGTNRYLQILSKKKIRSLIK